MRSDLRQGLLPTFSNVVSPSPCLGDDGLFLGPTQLIRRASSPGRGGLSIEEDADRCLALLSVAYRFPVAKGFLRHVAAAEDFWDRNEPAIANFRLLFAGLPRINDPSVLARVQASDFCLKKGVTPFVLLEELGIGRLVPAMEKYDPGQPRVPAGSGRPSGQWVRGVLSFLELATPEVLTALTRFASRFSLPTAVLGALFIPTPNSGGVTSGTLPGAPDIRFDKDGPAGRLSLTTTATDGSTVKVEARLQAGIYVDVSSGMPIGRDLDGQLYLDLDSVRKTIEEAQPESAQGEPDEKPKAATDEPKLCPAPTPDKGHGANPPATAYEQLVHERVNPLAPLSPGLAVKVIDPLTGKEVNFDDCFRYQGDLIDNNMKPGDLADAKGPTYDFLLAQSWSKTLKKLTDQAVVQLRAADARGVGLKWYFAEQGAADKVRAAFSKSDLKRIVIGYMPPR